jgi:hypothetical protein
MISLEDDIDLDIDLTWQLQTLHLAKQTNMAS